jgi:uncharacterized membrane protein (DUF485 family)
MENNQNNQNENNQNQSTQDQITQNENNKLNKYDSTKTVVDYSNINTVYRQMPTYYQTPYTQNYDILQSINNTQDIEYQMMNYNSSIKGWNKEAMSTVKMWYNVFKELSFIYQNILDKNQRIASTLSLISIISSSILGIFTAFKLWLNNDVLFSIVTDIILMIFNFIIAMIIATSKKYLDDARNEKIKIFVGDIDAFLGVIMAQLCKMPKYRMVADEFFDKNNEIYTRLISSQPNLSIDELTNGKELYQIYKRQQIINLHSKKNDNNKNDNNKNDNNKNDNNKNDNNKNDNNKNDNNDNKINNDKPISVKNKLLQKAIPNAYDSDSDEELEIV